MTLTSLPFPSGSTSFVNSTAHGLTSTPFEPHYPGAFTLASSKSAGCLDLHPIFTGFNAFCLLLTTLFLSPSPPILFSILIILGYLQITLISDPPLQPPDWSGILGGILPALFTGYWIYITSFRRTLNAFSSLPFELALWQGAGYWIGIESSTIFAKLPISRLGYGGLDNAGIVTLVIIVGVVVIVVGIQAWQMRKAGLLQFYLVRSVPSSVFQRLGTNSNPDTSPLSQFWWSWPKFQVTRFGCITIYSRSRLCLCSACLIESRFSVRLSPLACF